MKDTVIVDLDGTLADGRARYPLVSGKHRDYAAFHARLEEDPVNEWCAALVARFRFMDDYYLENDTRVVLVSARPKSAEAATRRWLSKHLIAFDELHLVRPDGDNTPDQELKRAWVRAYGKERILFAVDDRQKVVDMWREEGLTCLQCADWKEKPGILEEQVAALRAEAARTARVVEAAKMQVRVLFTATDTKFQQAATQELVNAVNDLLPEAERFEFCQGHEQGHWESASGEKHGLDSRPGDKRVAAEKDNSKENTDGA